MKALILFQLSSGTLFTLLICGLIMLILFSFLFIYYVLAPNDIFFTFGKENVVKYIMKGQKFSGKIILPSKKIFVDDNYNLVDHNYHRVSHIKKFNLFGIYFVGLWPFYSIHYRNQQWMEWESTEKGRVIRFRKESTPYLIVKPFEYAMLLEEGEDKNGMPLNMLFTVILQPTNLILPIFGNDDAYGQVQTLCLGEALLFVRDEIFSEIGGDKNSSNSRDKFSDAITSLNFKIPGRYRYNSSGFIEMDSSNKPIEIGLIEALGYKILDAKINSIEIMGKNKEALVEASTAEYIATEHAKAKIADAAGDRDAMILRSQGKQKELEVQENYYRRLMYIPGAMDVEKRKATPSITTLVEDPNGKTQIIVGGK